ncbi:MAG: hypothetical protein MJY83_01495 [Bacteroidales bacterium]|nr:hypothetical protein [Bacteroidales bacterium]
MRSILPIFMISFFISCSPQRLQIEDITVRYPESIPQEGTTLSIIYKYAKTKFDQQGQFQIFQYRLILGDEVYSHEYICHGTSIPETLELDVIVPENDSHDERRVMIEVSTGGFLNFHSMLEDYDGASFTKWERVYDGSQKCLNRDQETKYCGIKDQDLMILYGKDTLFVDLENNGTAQALRRILSNTAMSFRCLPRQFNNGSTLTLIPQGNDKFYLPANHIDYYTSTDDTDNDLYIINGQLCFSKQHDINLWCSTPVGRTVNGKDILSSIEGISSSSLNDETMPTISLSLFSLQ